MTRGLPVTFIGETFAVYSLLCTFFSSLWPDWVTAAVGDSACCCCLNSQLGWLSWERLSTRAIHSVLKDIYSSISVILKALDKESYTGKYDDGLFIELRLQYIHENCKLRTCSEHEVYINCSEYQNKKQYLDTTCSEHVLSLQFSCTEHVIQWTICRHIVG